MASSSIFIYELSSPEEINIESIYSCLKSYPEDENTYFNLEMISANELLGEYVIVQNAQESYYNPEQRVSIVTSILLMEIGANKFESSNTNLFAEVLFPQISKKPSVMLKEITFALGIIRYSKTLCSGL